MPQNASSKIARINGRSRLRPRRGSRRRDGALRGRDGGQISQFVRLLLARAQTQIDLALAAAILKLQMNHGARRQAREFVIEIGLRGGAIDRRDAVAHGNAERAAPRCWDRRSTTSGWPPRFAVVVNPAVATRSGFCTTCSPTNWKKSSYGISFTPET